MRNFMDDVTLRRGSRRGHGSAHGQEAGDRCLTPLPPLFLATAIEAVIRAGDVQMARFGSDMRVDKKGAIDLVTEVDLQIEREFRAMIAERFPDHVVLGEEFETRGDREATPPILLGLRSGRRHDQLRARPADLLLVAGARDRRRDRGRRDLRPDAARAVHGRARAGRVAERRAAARLGGRHADRFAARAPGFHYDIQQDPEELVSLFREFITQVARRAAAGVGGARPLLRRRRTLRRLLGVEDPAVGRRRRRADRRRGRRPGHDRARRARSAPAPAACWRATATSTT